MSETIAVSRRPNPLPSAAIRRPLQAVSPLLILIGIAVVWEVAKALFRVTDFNLPHVYDILGAFLVRTSQGPLLGQILLRAAAVTWFEALVGFVLGGILGLALAVLFVHSPLLERGLLPYVVMSQTVPIL